MIAVFRLIEAKDYRCLREVSQALNPFEILVGANASGKSTFLDAIAFVGDFVREGLQVAVQRRTSDFEDLIWSRRGATFRFMLDALIPPAERPWTVASSEADSVRYTVSVRLDTESRKLEVSDETMSLLFSNGVKAIRPVIVRSGDVVRYTSESGSDRTERSRLRNASSLQSVPSDAEFPATAWLRELFEEGIKKVDLDPRELAKPSPFTRVDEDRIRGSDIAWWVDKLERESPARFKDWLSHVRTALPDIQAIDSVLQQWNNERYVRIHYDNRVLVPSWMLSEGTLRLLALTILAYLPDFQGVYLVEEPENGVHPTALETIYQSLSSVYDAQVLVASHSPILLNMASPDQILIFSKTAEGAKIVRGSDHPALQDWRKEVSLGTLAASGILG